MARIGNYSGSFQPLWRFCSMLKESVPIDDDKDHWTLRAYLLANDRDQQCGDLPLLLGLMLRKN